MILCRPHVLFLFRLHKQWQTIANHWRFVQQYSSFQFILDGFKLSNLETSQPFTRKKLKVFCATFIKFSPCWSPLQWSPAFCLDFCDFQALYDNMQQTPSVQGILTANMTPGYFTTADVRSALSFGTVSMSTHIFSTNAKDRFPVWLSVTLFTVCIRLSTFAFRHPEIMKQKIHWSGGSELKTWHQRFLLPIYKVVQDTQKVTQSLSIKETEKKQICHTF